MSRRIDEERLVHYFAGECSAEEEARIRAWMREDPARRRHVEALRELWETAGAEQQSQPRDLDAMWEELSRQLWPAGARRGARSVRLRAVSREPVRRRASRQHARRPSSRPLHAAAAVLIIAVATFIAVQVFETPLEGLETLGMQTIATEAGQRTQVRLSDGTRVLLGPRSTLALPDEFAAEVREVHLQGQAYFEVAPDEERPFIVRAGEATAQVLGTEFSTQAYPGDDEVQVVVAEGRVAMRSEQAEDPEDIVLTRGRMGRLVEKEGRVVSEAVDLNRHLAWTEGRLVFEDAPFGEVAEQLARWYDLEVKLASSSASVDRLNATFEDESVREVLDVVARTLNLRYKKDERVVTFYPAT